MPADLLARRAVAGSITFADPAGNLLEAFCGPEIAREPFQAGREISGFGTGVMDMGHAGLLVKRLDDVQWFIMTCLASGSVLCAGNVQGILLPPQPAPLQPGTDRGIATRHPSNHDGN